MKKKILSIALAVCLALGSLVIIPMSVSAWTWKDDGHFEVAEHKAPIVTAGSIAVDAMLDDAYIGGTKIVSYPDDAPYRRDGYESVFNLGRGEFIAYIAADTKGLYIYAEIEDATIFKTTNTNGNDGDCFQIYLDWCPSGAVHPSAEDMYSMYKNGSVWDYAAYKKTYANSTYGQYLGWLSGDYNGVFGGSGGFSNLKQMGPNKNEKVVYKTRFIDGGWACEWFIPWRDQTQKNAVANGQQFHVGIGLQSNDDCDIDDTVTSGKEENVAIAFDQRSEIGLSYWADYSMLSDVVFTGACAHDWIETDSAIKTCKAFGYKSYFCSKCNGEKTEVIPASHVEKTEFCSVAGKKDVICADCGEFLSEKVAATGPEGSHCYFYDVNASILAYCTEGGYDAFMCKYCGDTTGKVTPAKGHNYYYSNKLDKYICRLCSVNMDLGDANCDGVISNADVLMIYRYIYDPESYPLPAFDVADVDRNGIITNADVLKIYRNIYDSDIYPIEREKAEFQLNYVSISEYLIVYPDGCTGAERYAKKLRDAIAKASGVELKVISDAQPFRNDMEILVGYSSRIQDESRSLAQKISKLASDEYLAIKDGYFIYLGGKASEDICMSLAVNKLIEEIEKADNGYAEINITDGKASEGTKYSVITYNDGDNKTTNPSQVAKILKDYAPDIVGMQEVQSKHISVYESYMSGYKGIYYDHDTTSYGAPIFYNTNKFTLVESGTQWLSDTPDTKYTKYSDSDYIRSYVYAILKDKSTGEEIVVVNTHVDYVASANSKQIAVLLDCTERFKDRTVIYTGDFNMRNYWLGYARMKNAGFVDCGTALGVNVSEHIDFCFIDPTNTTAVSYKYIDDHQYSSTASDHCPVYAEILVHAK